jgi:hypothetical protein
MGNVPLTIARVGLLNRVVHPSSGLLIKKHNPATKKNWTMVKVTGNLKLLRITLPVFELRAEQVYQSRQSATNRIVCIVGVVNRGTAKGLGEGVRVGVGEWALVLRYGLGALLTKYGFDISFESFFTIVRD